MMNSFLKSKRRFFLSNSYIWIPLVIMSVLSIPVIFYFLPACEDHLGENYQPLQTLKFFYTKGQAFHKYGPMPNFMLAPAYGVPLLVWYVRGTFSNPSHDFPYGFHDPFWQISFLILQGRILFVLISLIAFAYFLKSLTLFIRTKWIITIAFLFCLGTNYYMIFNLPATRPDGPMLFFSAVALIFYIRILYLGFSVRRAFWFSLFVVFATSSKELAAFMFILPYLSIITKNCKRDACNNTVIRAAVVLILTTVIGYVLLNIIYAPHTWWQRMLFWLFTGRNTNIWGGVRSLTAGYIGSYVIAILKTMLNEFGPGGALVAIFSLGYFLVARPKGWVELSLPFISVTLFGLLPIGFSQERFYMIAVLGLIPLIGCGLQAMLDSLCSSGAKLIFMIFLGISLVSNLNFSAFAWLKLYEGSEKIIERHVMEKEPKDRKIHIFSLWPMPPQKARLRHFGYNIDMRSIQEIAAALPNDRPEIIYVLKLQLDFINKCSSFPKRAAMFKEESGFDYSVWPGLSQLGYIQVESVEPRLPSWFLFDWMPTVKAWKQPSTVLVFKRSTIPAQ